MEQAFKNYEYKIPYPGGSSAAAPPIKAPTNDEQFLRWQVSSYNSRSKEAGPNEYSCAECKNRRWFAAIGPENNFTMKPCRCQQIQQARTNAANSGLGDMLGKYTFDRYNEPEQWQQHAKEQAVEFTKDRSGAWLFIGGQNGAGKSHLSTAAATELLKRGEVVKYTIWLDIFKKLDSNRYNEARYNEIIHELTETPVLVIDDFLKQDKQKISAALEIAFEIINTRSNKNKVCIISSEYFIDEIYNMDHAIGGRITEKAKKYIIQLKRENRRDYRARA